VKANAQNFVIRYFFAFCSSSPKLSSGLCSWSKASARCRRSAPGLPLQRTNEHTSKFTRPNRFSHFKEPQTKPASECWVSIFSDATRPKQAFKSSGVLGMRRRVTEKAASSTSCLVTTKRWTEFWVISSRVSFRCSRNGRKD